MVERVAAPPGLGLKRGAPSVGSADNSPKGEHRTQSVRSSTSAAGPFFLMDSMAFLALDFEV